MEAVHPIRSAGKDLGNVLHFDFGILGYASLGRGSERAKWTEQHSPEFSSIKREVELVSDVARAGNHQDGPTFRNFRSINERST